MMEENNTPDQEEKTITQIEEEARERARASMTSSDPVQKTKPGQPEVAKLRKKGSRRTLFVAIFSLVLIIILAAGGDYLVKKLKSKDDAPDDSATPAKSSGTTQRDRDFSIDTNPFGFQPQKDKEDDRANKEPEESLNKPASAVPKPPPALNKTAALVSDSRQNQNRSSNSTTTTTTSREVSTTNAGSNRAQVTYTPCQKLLVKGADGQLHCPEGAEGQAVESGDTQNDNGGIAKITGVKRMMLDPNLYIPVDRYIPCSMMQRFVSDVAGRISCLISEDIYSANYRVKLIPAGTIARGVYRSGTLKHGQGRLFIVWTELRTPDYLQIPLTDTQASGQLGENGVEGWIDSHFWERFGNAMMLSTVQDVAAAAANQSPSTNRNTDYTENSRAAAAEMAKQALDNSINIPPTMYKNQGDIIGIMTGTDIDFSGVYRLRLKF